jgi:hypothetical protein
MADGVLIVATMQEVLEAMAALRTYSSIEAVPANAVLESFWEKLRAAANVRAGTHPEELANAADLIRLRGLFDD